MDSLAKVEQAGRSEYDHFKLMTETREASDKFWDAVFYLESATVEEIIEAYNRGWRQAEADRDDALYEDMRDRFED